MALPLKSLTVSGVIVVHTVLNIVTSFLNSEILCFNVHLQVATLDPDASVSEARALHGSVQVDYYTRSNNREAQAAPWEIGRGGRTRAQFCYRFACLVFFTYIAPVGETAADLLGSDPPRGPGGAPIAAPSHDRRTLRQRVSAHG